MRIFLSHSSRDKPLIREIQQNLPRHVRAWIDERELRLGQNLSSSIREAITTATDFVVIFIGPEAVRSEWVRRELEWALEHERHIGRVFVLPVIFDKDSWEQLPREFQDRRYLPCTDFTETGVKEFSKRLSDELFSWASMLFEPNSTHSLFLEKEEAIRRRDRVKKLARQIADDQQNSTEDTRLTKDRIELIVLSLEFLRKVELLALYELKFGKLKSLWLSEDTERPHILEVEFRFGDGKQWVHAIDLDSKPFGSLREEYGLGGGKYEIRDVFLLGIARLSEEERKEVFSGIEILRCTFDR